MGRKILRATNLWEALLQICVPLCHPLPESLEMLIGSVGAHFLQSRMHVWGRRSKWCFLDRRHFPDLRQNLEQKQRMPMLAYLPVAIATAGAHACLQPCCSCNSKCRNSWPRPVGIAIAGTATKIAMKRCLGWKIELVCQPACHLPIPCLLVMAARCWAWRKWL